MAFLRIVAVLSVVGVALAARHKVRLAAKEGTEGSGNTCVIKEDENSKGFGISISYNAGKRCKTECLYHGFFKETYPNNVIGEPETSDNSCKCYTHPSFGQEGASKEFWFQFRASKVRTCTKENCADVFETFADMYLRKLYHSDGSRMEVSEEALHQSHFSWECNDSDPTGIVFPPPAGKIAELRLRLQKCREAEKNGEEHEDCDALEALLKDLMGGGDEIELFEYNEEADFAPEEYSTDASDGDGRPKVFKLKPCESSKDGTPPVEGLQNILELCGQPTEGTTKETTYAAMTFDKEGEWGKERACTCVEGNSGGNEGEACCALTEAAKEYGTLLSFRLKRCSTKDGPEETNLVTIVSGCGGDADRPAGTHPSLVVGETLLPVKLSVAVKIASEHGESDISAIAKDDLDFPCAEA